MKRRIVIDLRRIPKNEREFYREFRMGGNLERQCKRLFKWLEENRMWAKDNNMSSLITATMHNRRDVSFAWEDKTILAKAICEESPILAVLKKHDAIK